MDVVNLMCEDSHTGRRIVTRVTKGTIEADISAAIVRFQREQQGRGPSEVKTHLTGDLIVVRSTGIFTPAETHLSSTEEGRQLIKSARHELRSIHSAEIEEIIAGIIRCKVTRSYYDVDAQAGEQIEVYVLETDLEKRLLRLELDRLSGLAPKPGT
ncbi:MAG: DUF2294 domain-containing protein [Armatimonadetes bacterium]|nr:DUF2294 domain-containing protein [Armatimonadota bacterium]